MKGVAHKGFSISIYLPTGDPDGFRVVSKSHWTGKGLVIPRASYPDVKDHPDLKAAGVYVLVGPVAERELPTVYIGEADPVGERLHTHYSKKDFWTWAVAFVSSDRTINKAHIEYLEACLVELAKQAKRCVLDNQNTPTMPALSEPQQADAETFLADMLSIYPILGINAFEKPSASLGTPTGLLFINSKGLKAVGYETGAEFVVKQASQCSLDEVPSIHQYLTTLRKDLIDNGVLVKKDGAYIFSQDYPFGSPSTAAGVILGRSANGRTEWKDANGRTLKEKQQAKMHDA